MADRVPDHRTSQCDRGGAVCDRGFMVKEKPRDGLAHFIRSCTTRDADDLLEGLDGLNGVVWRDDGRRAPGLQRPTEADDHRRDVAARAWHRFRRSPGVRRGCLNVISGPAACPLRSSVIFYEPVSGRCPSCSRCRFSASCCGPCPSAKNWSTSTRLACPPDARLGW